MRLRRLEYVLRLIYFLFCNVLCVWTIRPSLLIESTDSVPVINHSLVLGYNIVIAAKKQKGGLDILSRPIICICNDQ